MSYPVDAKPYIQMMRRFVGTSHMTSSYSLPYGRARSPKKHSPKNGMNFLAGRQRKKSSSSFWIGCIRRVMRSETIRHSVRLLRMSMTHSSCERR